MALSAWLLAGVEGLDGPLQEGRKVLALGMQCGLGVEGSVG